MRRLAVAALSLALPLALLGAIKLAAGNEPSSDQVDTQRYTMHSRLAAP